jgi:pyruvate dehydrogenase E2 component (dihydrolipoamide acetyltransferase)
VVPYHVLATPATRKLARDLDVNLGQLQGTGSHGRVTKEDVQMAYEGKQAASPRSSHPAPTASVPAMRPSAPTAPVVARGAIQKIPLKGIRKKIAESMSHSKHTAAHFSYVDEVDMTEIVNLRKSVAEEAKRRGVKLTFLPFIIKAVIPALREFPFLNASLDDEKQEIILKGDYNIGIATDTPNGLMVPVIKGADQKDIWTLAAEIHSLSEKARTGKIALDDLRGGTFTLTNAGSIGGAFTTPVINHPEVAIMGVNAIRKKPVVKDDQIVIRDMMYLSLSVDHRVVDGADAARFVNRVIFFLQDLRNLVFA